jgi:hypothetical protein
MKKKDWVGLKFNMLTVIENTSGQKVLCECDCGNRRSILKTSLYDKNFKSCGCHRRNSRVGAAYNAMTILEDYIMEQNGKSLKKLRYCIAQCKCGNTIKTETRRLIHGITYSCGCVSRKGIDMHFHAFKDKNSESMYWAGMMASDGNVYKNTIGIGLKESDVDHLFKLKEWINCPHNVYPKTKTKSYCLAIRNKVICDDLLEYGITPNKSLTYTPPLFCEQSPDFWRGMIDGDGHIGKKKPSIGLFGTKMACESFQRFVKVFCKSKAKVCKHGNIFSLRYAGPYAIQIMQKLYGNNPKFYLDRKYALANKFCNFALAHDSGII